MIPSDTNLAALRNIEDTDDGSNASILELIVTLRCRIDGVVQVQLWTPAQKSYALYVAICARNRVVVGGVPSHFVKGG